MRILIMGDSTMQQNYADTYPQVGWPQALPLFLDKHVEIHNFARNGCSTKSFRDLGHFDRLKKCAKPGDYCFIQFGHNDAKEDNPLRYAEAHTDYYKNLHQYIDELEELGVTPILLTSIYRRFFEADGTISDICHGDYPDVMKKVAKERNLILIDACSVTKQYLNELGDEPSKRLFMQFGPGIYKNYPNGLYDNTHLRFDGAYEISRLIIEEFKKINHPIIKHLQTEVVDE